jgi:hypothetical protein
LEVRYRDKRIETMPRLRGSADRRIDYRHVIWSLVQKPGAFPRYRYREEMFPSVTFRRAYDGLQEALGQRRGDIEYLRILHLAASTMESEVEEVLSLVLGAGEVPHAERVKDLVAPERPEVPDLEAPEVDLGAYDALLSIEEVA